MALATLMSKEGKVSSSAPEERDVYSYSQPTNDLAPEERNVSVRMDPIIASNNIPLLQSFRKRLVSYGL